MKKPEILSPAGDMEKLTFALAYGADAVYLSGSEFGMRTGAGNFTYDELNLAVAMANAKNARVMVTVNTMPRNDEYREVAAHIEKIADSGASGVIVADLGVLALVKKVAPKLKVNISTQANITNFGAANMYHSLGADRVVLARELTLAEIIDIRQNTPKELEIETFVHGSMCMSISGRCLLSNYLTGRDANRGNCAQPCRWKYSLVEEKRPGQYMPVIEDDRGSYIFNSKDMNMLPFLPELIEAGIDSFKIEGRAKSAYYTAITTNAYRQAVDLYVADPTGYKLPEYLAEEPYKVSHREYYTGFYFGEKQGEFYDENIYIRDWDVAAVVDSCKENGVAVLTQKNKFLRGDVLELLMPRQKPIEFVCDYLKNADGENIDSAPHAQMSVEMKLPCVAPPLSIVRRPKKQP